MIVSFGDRTTEDLFHGFETGRVRKLPQGIVAGTQMKLDMLDAARALIDLQSPPGNRLEPLRGDYKGYFSIRVNQQWRLVFRFVPPNAFDVKLTDYHS